MRTLWAWIRRFVSNELSLPEASARTILLGLLLLIVGLGAFGSALSVFVTWLAGEGAAAMAMYGGIGGGSVVALGVSMSVDRRRKERILASPRVRELGPRREVVLCTSGQPLTAAQLAELQATPAPGVLGWLAARQDGPWRWVNAVVRSARLHGPALERLVLFYTPLEGRFGQEAEVMEALASWLSDWLAQVVERRPEVVCVKLGTMEDVEVVRAEVSRQLAAVGGVEQAEKVVEVTLGTSGWTAGATLAAVLSEVDVSYIPQGAGSVCMIGGVAGPGPRLAHTELARILLLEG